MRLGLAIVFVAGVLLIGIRAAYGQTPSPSPPPHPGVLLPRTVITYPAGWNIVSGSAAAYLLSVPSALAGPLYTLRAGDTAYETVPVGPPNSTGSIQLAAGYWVYFGEPTEISLVTGGGDERQIVAPAGQYIMIGNHGSVPATVTGADAVYTYDPVSGQYNSVAMLQGGQGAFAFSASGATITVSSLVYP